MQLAPYGHYGLGIEAPTYAELVASAEEAIADIERELREQMPVTGWPARAPGVAPGAPPGVQLLPAAPGAPLPDDRWSWLWWVGAGVVVLGAAYYFGKKRKA